MRNFLINNFESYFTRFDKGQFLENFFFNILLQNYYPDEIKFWRTVEGEEIDFIVGNNAYEVKVKKNLVKTSKYRLFIKKYPDINFKIVDEEDIFQGT